MLKITAKHPPSITDVLKSDEIVNSIYATSGSHGNPGDNCNHIKIESGPGANPRGPNFDQINGQNITPNPF